MNPYEILKVAPTVSAEELHESYRKLAKRWHPDRFQAGPERDWANEKMAIINQAYHMCLNNADRAIFTRPDEEQARLADVQRLIDNRQYASARKMLMGFTTRCAEWNYLFGALLLQMRETEKALIYLSVAAHQNPQNSKYVVALRSAKQSANTAVNRLSAIIGKFKGNA